MVRRRQGRSWRLTIALLAVLVLVPLALQAHVHTDAADHAADHACASCMIAHHVPLAHAAPPLEIGTLLVAFSFTRALSLPHCRTRHTRLVGRAPPFSANTEV